VLNNHSRARGKVLSNQPTTMKAEIVINDLVAVPPKERKGIGNQK
jgi:hypothetical protein